MQMDPRQKVQPVVGDGVNRRDFILSGMAAGVVAAGGLGAFYFGYDKAIGSPLRVGVIGTGDEGSVLIGAINPEFIQVCSIADIRPYNIWRAFHGDHYSETAMAVRPGLMAKYGWKTETEARRYVSVYEGKNGGYEELIRNATRDGLEGVIIALPLHLHAPTAMAAMQAGLHVLTEKLMAHSVHECKDMARLAEATGLLLATGHQRHYNILYANAVDAIERGNLGDLHYVRAQWNRGNMPGNDSWQPPMPEKAKPDDPQAKKLEKELKAWLKDVEELEKAKETDWKRVELLRQQIEQKRAQMADDVDAEKFGYAKLPDAGGKVYNRPAIEELIRWRLWDRTGAGLMAELGSHQLDAAGIFIHAAHKANDPKAAKPHPLSVAAAANRPLFPADRDIEDHVYCVIEYPAPDYDPKDAFAAKKKIGVQYSSINGNGFGGYGEVVFGTKGTLVLEKEMDMSIIKGPAATPSGVKVGGGAGGPTLDTQASGAPTAASKAGGGEKVSRGYTEELEHWAWCIRHPAPENQPRCGPKAAMADAVIALTTNMAARSGKPIKFKEEWFDIHSDATPEGFPPSTRGKS
jgi:predicted dehydrogenase